MQNTLAPKQIKKRLEELSILENEEKIKLNELHKRLEILDILENKEKEKLEKLQKQQAEEIKKAFEKTQQKKIKKEKISTPKVSRAKRIATLGLIGILGLSSQKMGSLVNKKYTKEETKKEIVITDKSKNIKEKEHKTIVIDRNKKQTEVKQPEVKKIEIKKEVTIPKKTIVQNTAEDDVFTIIEQPNANIDPSMYANRRILSAPEKNAVKNIYKELLATNDKSKATVIINRLDKKIMMGLKDILVKKMFLFKKAKKDRGRLQTLGQIIIIRENTVIVKNTPKVNAPQEIHSGNIALEVKKIQGEIANYTTQPALYAIQRKDENYDENKLGYDKIQTINFMLKSQGKDVGTIQFDRKGKLITREITKDNDVYMLKQVDDEIVIWKVPYQVKLRADN